MKLSKGNHWKLIIRLTVTSIFQQTIFNAVNYNLMEFADEELSCQSAAVVRITFLDPTSLLGFVLCNMQLHFWITRVQDSFQALAFCASTAFSPYPHVFPLILSVWWVLVSLPCCALSWKKWFGNAPKISLSCWKFLLSHLLLRYK